MEGDLDQLREAGHDDAGSFVLANSRLLKATLDSGTLKARLGTMVAYQGELAFERDKPGFKRLFKRALTSEGGKLMNVTGTGEVFVAHLGQQVFRLRLEDEAMTCNSRNLLAFESALHWDIQRVRKGLAGKVAGGLFNTHLSGTGWVALVADGEPILLQPSEAPTFADPQSAIAWSGTLETSFKTDFQLRTFIGLGSGESVQIGFQGEGWVLVQPSEGRRSASGGGGGGGFADLFSAAGG